MTKRSNLPCATSALTLALTLLASAVAVADVTPQDEYMDRIKASQKLPTLAAAPFGESIDLYTGGLGFNQVDLRYSGTGPDIVIAREFHTLTSFGDAYEANNFGDWWFNQPRIYTLMGVNTRINQSTIEWKVFSSDPYARCSQFEQPADAEFSFVDLEDWWHGYSLVDGNGSTQELLLRDPANNLLPSQQPAGSFGGYSIVTSGKWVVTCLPHTSNAAETGDQGEAFLAIAPDGTKYWFDHLTYSKYTRVVASLDAPTLYNGPTQTYESRDLARMLVSRIEDRFGNYITYNYTNDRVTSISGSDGRLVTINYRDDFSAIDSITMQPGAPNARTWHYEYSAGHSLTGVVLPDNSRWAYNLTAIGYASFSDNSMANYGPLSPGSGWSDGEVDRTVTVQHPSGLVGTFYLGGVWHAHGNVNQLCYTDSVSTKCRNPALFKSLSLLAKEISGPGLATSTWFYTYSKAKGSNSAACDLGPCPDTAWVEERGPNRVINRSTFSTRWGPTEGKLLRYDEGVTEPGADNPLALRTTQITLASASGNAYPAVLGASLNYGAIVNTAKSTQWTPQLSAAVTVQGETFQTTVDNTNGAGFDQFAQPLNRTLSSSLGYSRAESMEYFNDNAHWALGATRKVTDVGSGKVMAETTFNTLALPTEFRRFGLLTQTLTYNAQGQVASATDGRGNTITLGDWARGVPRLITYPAVDGVTQSQSASLDELGQIVAVQDELASTTHYGYDSLGRMAQVTYPTGDTTAWNPLQSGFVQLSAGENGVDAGYWKQTVSTGNGLTTTYLNARWQPVLVVTEDSSNAGSRSFVVTRYDDYGHVVFNSYPVASLGSVDDPLNGTTTVYDTLGRVTQVRQDSELGVLTTTTEYLPDFQTRVTNPRGFQTTTSYQAFDQPDTSRPVKIDAPEGVTTTIVRDGFGKPLSVTRSESVP